MALTYSTMSLPLGSTAPDFALPDPTGRIWSLKDFKGASALLVIFMCNHCPYVIHIREALAEFTRQYQAQGVAVVGINANDATTYPEDAPEKMQAEIAHVGYDFPYLYDESQQTAKAYKAACTPDFFLFDRALTLVYQGQFDASRPGNNIPVSGKDLAQAIETLLSEGQALQAQQIPSMGCNIKWKVGNEPDYFSS